jgi:hypothetical protein
VVITKHQNTGGLVSVATVSEQLLYEIGDPREYITPDGVADFTSIRLTQAGENRVEMSGVKGRPATAFYKVSMAYQDGYLATGTLTYAWPDALEKAKKADEILRTRLKDLGLSFQEIRSELLGYDSCFGPRAVPNPDQNEVVLRIGVRSGDKSAVERSPALTQKLSSSVFSQLCRLHEHVMLLGRKSASERIASFLMRCIPARGRGKCPGPPEGDDSARVPLAMTRLEIADFLGLTIETVSRVLTRLKRRGILSIKKLDEVGVSDVCRLCRLSGTHLTNGRWCSSRGETQPRE